ncbi:transmembrane protein 132D, partial [Tachysurus ichikawai]
VQYGEGINFIVVKPSNIATWEIKQEVAPGSASFSIFCERKTSSSNESVRLVPKTHPRGRGEKKTGWKVSGKLQRSHSNVYFTPSQHSRVQQNSQLGKFTVSIEL